MACFADINLSQGSVATYARCGGIFDKFLNLLRIDRIMVMSLWPVFWPTLYIGEAKHAFVGM